jgi:hypothetical protein
MTAPERGTATIAADLARRIGSVARALVAAGRSWSLYPPEHPAVRSSVDRLASAGRDAAAGHALSFGVGPDSLLVEAVPVATREGPTTEAAAVIAAYRHLSSIVEVMAPERRADVMQNLASAAATMDPRIVIEMLRASEAATAAAGGVRVGEPLAGAFDSSLDGPLLREFGFAALMSTSAR